MRIATALVSLALASTASAEVIFQQLPSSTVQFFVSSRWGEDGSDYDEYTWDNFTLASTRAITEVHWRGGYVNVVAPITQFEIAIYGSIGGGSQPDIGAGPLVHYMIPGNAGQTPAGSAGGVSVFDYGVTLPTPFNAVGGTKYWVEILAWQDGFPFWSIQRGTGGNNSHFRFSEGLAMFHTITGDLTFSLVAAPLPCPADLNHDSTVDAADLSLLLGAWGSSGTGDLTGDGTVNAADLSVMLGAWGPCG